MHELYELKEKLMNELKDLSRKDISGSSLQTIDTLAHATKNLCKIIESADGEYSEDGGSYRMGGYPRRGGSYRGGSSYRRDSRGRYASRYYDANDEMIEKLDEMMESADESVKADIMKLRQKLESR